MKRLDRDRVEAPECLKSYRSGEHTWSTVSDDHKKQIWSKLTLIQGSLCAYCEGDLINLGQHIEHLRSRGQYPGHTFGWENLYGSCNREDSCGIYKDREANPYDPNDLIAPAVEDPDRFFRFRTDGTIDLRPGLSDQEVHRALETLRVINLDPSHGRLRGERKRTWRQYASQEPDLLEVLEAFTAQERAQWIFDELIAIADQAFSTVIRHFLQESA